MRGVAGISEEDELVIPAEIHALEFVKEHLPFVFIGTRVIVRDGAGDVLDGADVFDIVPGHVERCFHLVVLRMTGNFRAVKVIRAEVVLVKSGVGSEVAGTWRSNTESGQIEYEAAGCAVKRAVGLTGEGTGGDEAAGSTELESGSGNRQCSEGVAFLMLTPAPGDRDGIQRVFVWAAHVNFIRLPPDIAVAKAVWKKIVVNQILDGDLRPGGRRRGGAQGFKIPFDISVGGLVDLAHLVRRQSLLEGDEVGTPEVIDTGHEHGDDHKDDQHFNDSETGLT